MKDTTLTYSHVIFDWDGTLGMTLHLWLAGYREALHTQGHTFLDSIIARDFFYEHDKGVLKYPDINFELLVTEARAHVFSHLDDLQLYEGVKEVLDNLTQREISISLVSSSPRKLVERGLEVHGIVDYFSSVMGGDDVTKHKPDPEAFNTTLQYMDVSNPEKVLIIGDAKTDILAGHAAQTMTCLFTPDENKIFYNFDELLESKPDHQISNMTEILKI